MSSRLNWDLVISLNFDTFAYYSAIDDGDILHVNSSLITYIKFFLANRIKSNRISSMQRKSQHGHINTCRYSQAAMVVKVKEFKAYCRICSFALGNKRSWPWNGVQSKNTKCDVINWRKSSSFNKNIFWYN